VFHILQQVCGESSSAANFVAWVVMAGVLPVGPFFPLYLIYHIGSELEYSLSWWVGTLATLFFSLSALIIFFSFGA